jgi:5-methylcytosine-specific restriction endonuclease McrA
MRKELFILFATAAYLYDIYYDGKLTTKLLSYKKYYYMAFCAILGVSIYYLFSRTPERGKRMLFFANKFIKQLPMDTSAVAPILDFTESMATNYNHNNNTPQTFIQPQYQQPPTTKIKKRCVSETKKKFVASKQQWKCEDCSSQLDHTFEIDHKLRLEYGGSNDESNLVALCRNCHGKKTASENM